MKQEIVNLAIAGNMQALEHIYNATIDRAYAIALSVVKDEFEAQDITQEAYITVFQKLNTVENASHLEAWIASVVRNKAIDYTRKNHPELFSDIESKVEDDFSIVDTVAADGKEFHPEEQVDYQETQKLLWGIVNELPEKQRLCVVLRYQEDLKIKEIASRTGLAEATVKSCLKYAHQKIEAGVKKLEKEGTKLYSFTPLMLMLLLRWLLGGKTAAASVATKAGVVSATAAGAGAASGVATGVKVAAKTAKVAAKMSLAQKICAVVLAATITVGAAVGITQLQKETASEHTNAFDNNTSVDTNFENSPSTETEKDNTITVLRPTKRERYSIDQLVGYDLYSYNAKGQPTSIEHFNMSDDLIGETIYSYDGNGYLLSEIYTTTEGQVQYSYYYTWDADGNLVEKSIEDSVFGGISGTVINESNQPGKWVWNNEGEAAPAVETDPIDANEYSETLKTLNAMLAGTDVAQESNVSDWTDEQVCYFIGGKLMDCTINGGNDSYLQELTASTNRDGYELHYDISAAQTLARDLLGRELVSSIDAGLARTTESEIIIMMASGENTTYLVESFTYNGDLITAIGTAKEEPMLNYVPFEAVFIKNPTSMYGYTLISFRMAKGAIYSNGLVATASSELNSAKDAYAAKNVLDGDLSTAWVEGVDGIGVNEWITIQAYGDSAMTVSSIDFAIGYQKNEDILQKNGYPTKILIECEGGYRQEVELHSYTQSVPLNQTLLTDWVRITILEAESGSEYDDICISEIAVLPGMFYDDTEVDLEDGPFTGEVVLDQYGNITMLYNDEGTIQLRMYDLYGNLSSTISWVSTKAGVECNYETYLYTYEEMNIPEGCATTFDLLEENQILSSNRELPVEKHCSTDGNTVNEITYYSYDMYGNLVGELKRSGVDGSAELTVYMYNATGELAKKVMLSESETTTISYSYNELGQLCEEEWHKSYGINELFVYSYDEAGFLVRCDQYDADDHSYMFSYLYTYDDKGREKSGALMNDLRVVSYMEWTYTENSSICTIDEGTAVSSKTITTYNDHGDVISEEMIMGEDRTYTEYSYVYKDVPVRMAE